MSVYHTLSGQLGFKSSKDFNRALKILRKDGFLLGDRVYAEVERPASSDDSSTDIDPTSRAITFPFNFYRNVSDAIDKILSIDGCSGELIMTCLDACVEGETFVNGVRKSWDLEKWARKQGLTRPRGGENSEFYVDWLLEIEEAFHHDR
jgi:hypothetical protein